MEEKFIMNKYTRIAAAVLGVVATMGVAGVANAAPLLQIITTGDTAQEVVGDAGGSIYPYAGGPGFGAGVPSSTTTPSPWPNGPGFAPDPTFGNAPGTSGFDASYLWLTQSANVTFQFMGGGNSDFANQFWVNGVQLFQDPPSNNATNPCPVSGTTPSCDILGGGPLGQNQYTMFLNVAAGGGYIPFQFITGAPTPVTLDNTGAGNGNPSDDSGLPGYMLGIDPYLATGTFQTEGTAVYAALSDRTRVGNLDHDYSDLGVRISVPEPGSIFLLGAGLMGLAFGRRRQYRNMA